MNEQKQLTPEQQKTMARLAIQRAVAQASDALFVQAQGPGEKLRKAKLDTGQIRNLENIAYSTDRLSDIYDFLKRQMGRPGDLGKKWQYQGVGQDLLNTLADLHKSAREIVGEVRREYSQGVDEDTERRVHLMLCREYLKHVAAHYLYTGAVENE
jgi:hypothetical protein